MNKPMTLEECLAFLKPLIKDRKSLLAQDTKVTTNEKKPTSEMQVGGDHYTKCGIQPWNYIIANDLDYFQGSIIKYVTRWKDKGWVEDLYKARHFLDKYIETMEQKHKHLKERPE